jgi:hypothetical protein
MLCGSAKLTTTGVVCADAQHIIFVLYVRRAPPTGHFAILLATPEDSKRQLSLIQGALPSSRNLGGPEGKGCPRVTPQSRGRLQMDGVGVLARRLPHQIGPRSLLAVGYLCDAGDINSRADTKSP